MGTAEGLCCSLGCSLDAPDCLMSQLALGHVGMASRLPSFFTHLGQKMGQQHGTASFPSGAGVHRCRKARQDLAADGLLFLRSPTALKPRPARSGWQPRALSRDRAALHAGWRKSAAGHGQCAELVAFSTSHDNLWPQHSSMANCSSESCSGLDPRLGRGAGEQPSSGAPAPSLSPGYGSCCPSCPPPAWASELLSQCLSE